VIETPVGVYDTCGVAPPGTVLVVLTVAKVPARDAELTAVYVVPAVAW
jgi:hypothetical protein